jgi:glycerol-3-phosphate dehydrogenase
VFAGQRPLAAPKKEGKSAKEISRSHKIIVSDNDLITITGGKWTSYRLMAEDTIDKAISMKLVDKRKCVTKHLKIHGWRPEPDLSNHYYIYGSEEPALHQVEQENVKYQERISPKYDYTFGEVVWAVRHEMARTLDDVLARRVRLLYIDAREALRVAPEVAKVMATELGMSELWIDEQVAFFSSIAKNYIVDE